MKMFKSKMFRRQEPAVESIDTPGSSPIQFKQAATRIVEVLLEDEPLPQVPILEASVHRARRSKIWVATFTGPTGGQIWKSTGTADFDQATLLARHWESQARAQRAKLGRAVRKPSLRVRQAKPGAETGQLSQKEVAKILHMSERGVREVERRAFQKLRNHPLLKQLWHQYLGGNLDEARWILTPEEIQALFDVARTDEELFFIEKVVRLINATCARS